MRLWMTYLFFILAGVGVAFFLPADNGAGQVLFFLGDLTLNLGRYILFPLVFFSMPVAICQIKRLGKFRSLLIRIILYTLAFTAVMLIIGMGASLFLSTERIPITIQEDLDYKTPDFKGMMQIIISPNLFQIFTGDSSLLLPLCVLAFFLGSAFHFDREQAGPAFNLFDSLSRIFYRINWQITRLQALLMCFVSFVTTRSLMEIRDFSFYTQHIIVLAISSAVFLFVIYPLTLLLIGGRGNPLSHVYSIMTPLLTGLISGDLFYNYGILTAHLKENEGIPREIGGVAVPFFTLFARSGTALVGGASMLLIIRSYTSLDLTFYQIMWVFFFSYLFSFAISYAPRLGIYAMLTLLCNSYGRGLDRGYILLLPMLPILIGFSAFLDTACIALLTRITAYNENLIDEAPSGKFL